MEENRKMVREPLRVIILSEHYRIIGTVYLDIGSRLSDFVNSDAKFIPVKDVTIESLSEKDKFVKKYDFINLNKDYVIAIFPENQKE